MFRVIPVAMAFLMFSFAHAEIVGDIDGNGQVGLPEAIYSLQSLAGMRPPLSVAGEIEITSGYLETSGASEQPIITVPSDRIFVLTDLVVTFSAGYHRFLVIEQIGEIKTTKLSVHYSDVGVNSLSRGSGIPFGRGATILIQTTEGAGRIVISGYLRTFL